MSESFYTPNDIFYVRSHLATPDVDAASYELEVSGFGIKGEKVLTLENLKKFPKMSVTAAVQCGGNRRAEMRAEKELKGLDWKGGAIGNAKWTGAKLYDVLKAAGVDEEDERIKHVIFEGYDVGADGSPYGASIPVSKALDPRGDVILAYEMNGKTLSRDHGYPVRVIVPGTVGARCVKWVKAIILSDVESDSHWQQSDYKGFSPSTTWDNVDYSKSPAIQAMPVTSAICIPPNGCKIKAGKESFKVKGYAWSGGGNRIIRIDLTTDGGNTWYVRESMST